MHQPRNVFHFIKTALVTGALIVLPAWLSILLLASVLNKLRVIVKPLTNHMPSIISHPKIIAVVVFLLICLLVGILVHTAIGRLLGKGIESNVLKYVPGYSALRSMAAQAGKFESENDFQPAMILVEDGSLSPAFLIEVLEDGRCTVFMPSVPTPMAGAILVMPGDRVYRTDVRVATIMKCIFKWGAGTGKLVQAMDSQPVTPTYGGPGNPPLEIPAQDKGPNTQ